MKLINNSSNSIQQRIDLDLLKRSISGAVIYAFLFPIIFGFYHFYQSQPIVSWAISIVMITLSIFRGIHYFYSVKLYAFSPKVWLVIFSIFSFSQALILGVVLSLSFFDNRFMPISSVAMLALGGIAAGALTSLSTRLWLALINLSLLLLPSIVIAMFTDGKTAFVILISVYFVYLISLGLRLNKEYLRAFEIEETLETQRQALENLNKIDPLTHIFNRGHFNNTFEFQWHIAVRHQYQQSLLIIDIDHFKSINDTYGHLFGDECLKFIANIINDMAKRKTDLVARFGGEEFAVLLNDTPLTDALLIANAIKEAIANKPYQANGIELAITASIGIATMVPQKSTNPNLLIDQADKALYQAKNSGRNIVKYFGQ